MLTLAGFITPYLVALAAFPLLARRVVLPWLLKFAACLLILPSPWLIPSESALLRFLASISTAMLSLKLIDVSPDLTQRRRIAFFAVQGLAAVSTARVKVGHADAGGTHGRPGQHLQAARAIELGDLPHAGRSASSVACTEVRAPYAETVGLQLDLCRDPASRFGHLMRQMLRDRVRAARGVRFDIRSFQMSVLDQGAVLPWVLQPTRSQHRQKPGRYVCAAGCCCVVQ